MPAREADRSIVVCGLHRSGTSVIAHALSRAGELSLLDDPDWAVFGTNGPLALARDAGALTRDANALARDGRCAAEVAAHDVAKIPRAAEVLPTLVRETPHRYVVCFRDPLDVFASIVEAQYSDHPTVASMLYYQTIDPRRTLSELDRYCAAYSAYATRALDAVATGRARLVSYARFLAAPDAVAGRLLDWLDTPRRRTVRRTSTRVDPDHNKPLGAKRVQGVGRGDRHLPPSVTDHLRSALLPAFHELLAAHDDALDAQDAPGTGAA